MKKCFACVLALLLLISIAFNLYFLYRKDNYIEIKSFDNKFSADILDFKNRYSIQITSTEGNITDKSMVGRIDFCSDIIYSSRFGFDVVWSPNSYNLFVLSLDIGIYCIHYNEEKQQWNEYCCYINEDGSVDLRELDSNQNICTISKENVPDEVFSYPDI